MKKILLALILIAFAFTGNANAATLDTVVTADGDALWHTQIHVGNWWVTGDPTIDVSCWGGNYNPWEWTRCTGYMQYSLSELVGIAPADISSVYVSLYIESIYIGDWGSGVGAGNLYHASNSSSANGGATQGIGGDQWVGLISEQPLGWVSFDVTDYIKSDLTNGYAYSAFSMSYTFGGEGSSGTSFAAGESSNASFLRFDVPPTYAYYASGRLQSVTYAVPEDGNTYIEYLDEDWNGQGFGRMSKRIAETADEDNAIAFECVYPDVNISTAIDFDLNDGGSKESILCDLGTKGIWRYSTSSGWSRVSATDPENVYVGDLNNDGVEDALLDFGAGIGIYKYVDATSLEFVCYTNPENMYIANLDGSGAEDVLIDFGSGIGIYKQVNNSALEFITYTDPENIYIGDFDGNSSKDALIDFGAGVGVYKYTNSGGLSFVTYTDSQNIQVGDFDGNGQDDALIDFGAGIGIYKYMNGSGLEFVTYTNPESIYVGDFDGNGQSDSIIDFGSGIGIYKLMNNGSLEFICYTNPQSMYVADLDDNGSDDVVMDFGSGIGTYKYMNGSSLSFVTTTDAESMYVADLDGNGSDDIVMDFGSGIGIYKYMNGSSLQFISTTDPQSISVADLNADGADDLVIDFGLAGTYKYFNSGELARITTANSDREKTIKGYSDDLFTYLVYTESYDASGNLTGTVYEGTSYYASGHLKREYIADGTIKEYFDEPENLAALVSSYSTTTLYGSYTTDTWYETYDWDPDTVISGLVEITKYDGDYTVTRGSDVLSGVVDADKSVTYTYEGNGAYGTYDPGWIIRGQRIYNPLDENVVTHYYEYYGDGTLSTTGHLMRGWNLAEDVGTMWYFNGSDEFIQVGSSYGMGGNYSATGLYSTTYSGVYTSDQYYETYDWTRYPDDKVVVTMYDGQYSVEAFAELDAGIETGKRRVEYYYDINGSYTTYSPEWVYRGIGVYSTDGITQREHHEYYADGETYLRGRTFGPESSGSEWFYDDNGTPGDPGDDVYRQVLYASYDKTEVLYGTYTADNLYATYNWTDDPARVTETKYDGVYAVDPFSDLGDGVKDNERRVEFTYEHHDNYDIDKTGWVMRQQSIYSTNGEDLVEAYSYYNDGSGGVPGHTLRHYVVDDYGEEFYYDEDNEIYNKVLFSSYYSTRTLYGSYTTDNSYDTYWVDMDYNPGQIYVNKYDGVYSPELESMIWSDVRAAEQVVSYTFDHHDDLADMSGWTLREQSIFSNVTWNTLSAEYSSVTNSGGIEVVEDGGDISISETNGMYGTTSAYFDGGYLGIGESSKWYFEEGDGYTIDLWFNTPDASGDQCLISAAGAYTTFSIAFNENEIVAMMNGVEHSWGLQAALVVDDWYHLALVIDTKNGWAQGYLNGQHNPGDDWNLSGIGPVNMTGGFLIGADSGENNLYYGYMDDIRISSGLRWTGDFTEEIGGWTEAEADENTMFLMNANGVDSSQDFSSATHDEIINYGFDEYGRLVEEFNAPDNTFKYMQYYDIEGAYSTQVIYQEEYDPLGRVPVVAYWFYESGRLWEKHVVDPESVEYGKSYEFHNLPGPLKLKTTWDTDGQIYGFDTNGTTLLWQQSDYTTRPAIGIDTMVTFEYYSGEYSTQYQWVNEYEWISDVWQPLQSHEFSTGGFYMGTYTTHTPEDVGAPVGIPLKPEFEYAAFAPPAQTSLEAPLCTAEDALLSEGVKAFFEKLDAMKAESTGEGVLVALLDTGVNAEGTDLRVVGGYDFAGTNRNSSDKDADYSDVLGHGTETAKVIGATAENADILAVKVIDDYSMTNSAIVAEAIRYAVDMGAKVLAMPLGLTSVNSLVTDAIEYASAKGAILVVAAGNDGSEILDKSLAAQDKLITVGSVDNDGKISAWSNYGDEVDLYAPWDIIPTTDDGRQTTEVGTSFSAAFVAGLAALVLENNPDFTADEVLTQLKGLFAGIQPKVEVKVQVEKELLSKQAALEKQNEEFTGVSPEAEILTKVIE